MSIIPAIGIARPDAQMKPISQRIFFFIMRGITTPFPGVKVSFSQPNING